MVEILKVIHKNILPFWFIVEIINITCKWDNDDRSNKGQSGVVIRILIGITVEVLMANKDAVVMEVWRQWWKRWLLQ